MSNGSFSHILTKPTKVTGHMNPGSSQEGLCSLEGYKKGESTPNLCVMLQNDGLTFFARDCHNTGLQSLHHDFW